VVPTRCAGMTGLVLALILLLVAGAGAESPARRSKTKRDVWADCPGVTGGQPVRVSIGGKDRAYLHLAAGEAVSFTASGGERIRITVRRSMKAGETRERSCQYFLATDDGAPLLRGKKLLPDTTAIDPSHAAALLSKSTMSTFTVPDGTHTYWVSAGTLAKYGLFVRIQHPAPPKAPPAGKPRRRAPAGAVHWKFGAKAGLELTYDSNVFRYSDRDIRRFHDDRGAPRFDNVSSIDDLVMKPTLDMSLRNDFVEGSPTAFALEATAYAYALNDRKDHGRFLAELKQHFGKDDLVRFQYIIEPDVFERTRFRTIRPRRDEASVYDKDEWTFRYWHRVSDALTLYGDYSYQWKDYNNDFDERDQVTHAGGLTAKVTLREWWTARVGYAYEDHDARADLENPSPRATVTDVSHFSHVVTVETGFDLSKQFALDLGWEHQIRHYTQHDPADVSRFHRSDRKDEFSAKLTYHPRKGLETWIEAVQEQLSTNLGGGPAAGSDSDLEYDDGRVTLGVEIGF